ncbi:MAG: cupin domain-containing protein [Candidatus Wallbacteria bacterium]|nr:cupin domain-containing protein [Candidatus Wallbacteria bacterium]
MFYAHHYQEVQSDEVKVDGAKNVSIRWLIDEKKGAPNFAMRLFDISRGGNTPYHTHPWEHEVFVVSGTGKLIMSGQEYPLQAGSVVYVPPGVEHNFVNEKEVVLQMICVVPKGAK